MRIYLRRIKKLLGPGHFYFGGYGEIPISISLTTIDRDNIGKSRDSLYFHKEGYEFYLTISGKPLLK